MYSQISANKRKTWFLITIVCTLMVVLFTALGVAWGGDVGSSIFIGTMFSTVYALISYYFSDKVALMASGAKEIQKKDAPELWNLVENLCMANGQPMPRIYVMPDTSLNAFATGRDPKHASIAFTTGIIQALTKQELEGVAAHELSHVKNYDIRVMTIVVVLVGAIALAADLLLRSSFGFDRDRKEGAAIFMVIGIVLSILAPFMAQLIQLAISRQREYLADASGALLTRYPEGLASALEKISKNNTPLNTANRATAHLFIANPFGKNGRKAMQNLFSTHPPAEDRIARLRGMNL